MRTAKHTHADGEGDGELVCLCVDTQLPAFATAPLTPWKFTLYPSSDDLRGRSPRAACLHQLGLQDA